MDTTTLIPFLMILVPGLITSIVMGANAKKLNAQWRERRDARLRKAGSAK